MTDPTRLPDLVVETTPGGTRAVLLVVLVADEAGDAIDLTGWGAELGLLDQFREATLPPVNEAETDRAEGVVAFDLDGATVLAHRERAGLDLTLTPPARPSFTAAHGRLSAALRASDGDPATPKRVEIAVTVDGQGEPVRVGATVYAGKDGADGQEGLNSALEAVRQQEAASELVLQQQETAGVEALVEEGAYQVGLVGDAGDTQRQRVEDEGDAQVAAVQAQTSAMREVAHGMAGVGRWIKPLTTATTVGTVVVGRVNHAPIALYRRTRIDRIGVEVTTGAPGSSVRLGIYAVTEPVGSPAANRTLVLDAGAVDASTAGIKTITVDEWLEPGLYTLVAAALGGTPALRRGAGVLVAPRLWHGLDANWSSLDFVGDTGPTISDALPATAAAVNGPTTFLVVVGVRILSTE